MALIPKYPLDTAAKLALIRAAGWYYDTKLKTLDWTPRENERARNAFGHCAQPLNSAFHYFIQNQGKEQTPVSKGNRVMTAKDIGATMLIGLEQEFAKVYAKAFDSRALYGTT